MCASTGDWEGKVIPRNDRIQPLGDRGPRGRIVDIDRLLVVGVNAEGNRKILGIDVPPPTTVPGGWHSRVRWSPGVQLVIVGDHQGLTDDIEIAMAGASRQRCRTLYLKNLLTKDPRIFEPMVATMVRAMSPNYLPTRCGPSIAESSTTSTEWDWSKPPVTASERQARLRSSPGFPVGTGVRSGPTTPRND